jgi:hypothetical protein
MQCIMLDNRIYAEPTVTSFLSVIFNTLLPTLQFQKAGSLITVDVFTETTHFFSGNSTKHTYTHSENAAEGFIVKRGGACNNYVRNDVNK